MVDVKRWSASKLTCYYGCPFAFFLRYVKHEPIPENSRLSFGKAAHYLLNRFYGVNFKSPESFGKFWNYYWMGYCAGDFIRGKKKAELKITAHPMKKGDPVRLGNHISWPEDDPVGLYFGYMKLGRNIMERFYKRHKTRKPPVLKEKRFNLNIDGHEVVVVYDRVDEIEDGRIVISDYKTDKGSPQKNSFVLHRHPQFTLYSLALRQLVKEGRVSFSKGQDKEDVIFYYHLRSGQVFETHRSEKDFEYIHHLLDEATKKVEADDFTPFYGFHCHMCDFQVQCEKYSVDHGGPRIDLEGKIKQAKPFTGWMTEEERNADAEVLMGMAEERDN